eukprot:2690077-Pleurochrysis_carterae.AAC.4
MASTKPKGVGEVSVQMPRRCTLKEETEIQLVRERIHAVVSLHERAYLACNKHKVAAPAVPYEYLIQYGEWLYVKWSHVHCQKFATMQIATNLSFLNSFAGLLKSVSACRTTQQVQRAGTSLGGFCVGACTSSVSPEQRSACGGFMI